MIVSLLIILFICLWKIKFNFSREGFSNYLEKNKTDSIKGLFILIVFVSHFNKYAQYAWLPDIYAFKIIGVIGQAMVIPFLVYSGYGVMQSIKRKGIEYVKAMPKNRILKVLVIFEFVNVFKIVIKIVLNGSIELDHLILSTLTWLDWFIFAIIILYFATYVAYLFFKNKNNYSPFSLTIIVVTVLYVIVLSIFGVARYYYDTVLFYSLGIIWSIYQDKLDKIFTKNVIFYSVLIMLAIICLLLKYFLSENSIVVILTYVMIGVLLLLITKKVQINNGILNWCGKHLFDIYLVHRIPMDVFYALEINLISNYLYFGLCAIVTLALVIVLDFTINKWVKRLNKKQTISL